MYSPKIREDLIPLLYKIAKEQEIPMTELVDRIIREEVSKYEHYLLQQHRGDAGRLEPITFRRVTEEQSYAGSG